MSTVNDMAEALAEGFLTEDNVTAAAVYGPGKLNVDLDDGSRFRILVLRRPDAPEPKEELEMTAPELDLPEDE